MTKWNPSPEQGILLFKGGAYIPSIFSETTWRPPAWDRLPPISAWASAKRIGFDFECKDELLRELGPGCRRRPESRTVGYSFCFEDENEPTDNWPRFYIPYAHGTEHDENSRIDNVDYDALGYLRDGMRAFHGDLVGANLAYDLDWGQSESIDFSNVHRFRDVLIADPLLFELYDEYSLEEVGKRRGVGGKDETLLRKAAKAYNVDPKGQMWTMPGRLVGPYAEVDAVRPLEIMRIQDRCIADEGIEACWDMECRLLPILVKMTRKGVRVNTSYLDDLEQWCINEETRALAAVEAATKVKIPQGESYNVELLSRALQEADLGHLIGKTAKTKKDSIHKDALFNEIGNVPEDSRAGIVAKALTRARQVTTVRTTFVAGVRKHLVNGRIHCSFNQIKKTDDNTGESSGVKYGRLSASHPNMQNQPGNSRFTGDNELGPMWRAIYEPEDGEDWASEDLKQQEPKLSFHIGAMLEEAGQSPDASKKLRAVKGALALCKALAENPQLDTYEPIVEIAGVPRSKAKVIWLARAYGKGDAGLCEDLGLPTIKGVFSKETYKWVPVNSDEGQKWLARGGRQKDIAGEEGQRIIDKFDTEMSFLKIAAKIASDRANDRGYVTLLDGRRCHFKPNDPHNPRPFEWDSEGSGYDWTHKAFNRIIQGNAAWQTKMIMIALDDAGYGGRLMLQVHDEVASSVPRGPEGAAMVAAMAAVMRDAVLLRVPTIVDQEIGESWGESMMVEYLDASGKKAKVRYRKGLTIVDGVPRMRASILDSIESSTVYLPADDPRLNTELRLAEKNS